MNLRLKWVFRHDNIQNFYRLCRVMWEQGTVGFDNKGYSAKLSFALDPAIFRWWVRDAKTDWRFTALCLRIHYCRSYGGVVA